MTDDAIIIELGACIDVSIAWTDQNGDPMDMTGYAWSVFDTSPASIAAAFDLTQAATGVIRMHVGDTSEFGLGRVNYFRLRGDNGGACDETTGRIWVSVQ